ncbi:MAG: bifunctional UDP-N-acetylglucosamine pyrophosphorylase / glucosamine-phosphate N-acetyltransferase [Methylobacteriaceae bacterium]|nr:bifunctional UDP-N-acetylglucosamine pyrophosphorylase / glucosamine-phosphate N-acetyltransferase [Methylobacteriaceae bacterium]
MRLFAAGRLKWSHDGEAFTLCLFWPRFGTTEGAIITTIIAATKYSFMDAAVPNRRKAVAVILAAGEGTRMKSALPKVLHRVAGRTLLAHALSAVREADIEDVAIVIGPGRGDVAAEARRIFPAASLHVQAERRGTAHAVLAARDALGKGHEDVLVLFADTPLIEPATLRHLREGLATGSAVVALGFEAKDPTGYGRLVRDTDGSLIAIREHRDASAAERALTLCNAGLMALSGRQALPILDAIGNDNTQREFYLPDAVAVARRSGLQAGTILASEEDVMGINDRVQLAEAEAVMQKRLREQAMRNGATLVAPETVFFSADTEIGRDVIIEPHVVFGPGVVIEDGAVIHSFSHLEGARIGKGVSVGPFARLRPGANLREGARVGNFVEIKAAEIGRGAKVNHLSYIGDATVGAASNIGAGTITCNYDGYAKHRTEIGDNAFIGTNSSLVAPVKIGAGAYIGSGSVITDDVAADALALGRGRQVEKPGWARDFRETNKGVKTGQK